jgi:hypothetical protein
MDCRQRRRPLQRQQEEEEEEEKDKKKTKERNSLRVRLLHTFNILYQNQTNKAGFIVKQIHQF